MNRPYREMRILAPLLAAAMIGGCATVRSVPGETVRGELFYRERMALPPDARVSVFLYDVSRPDVSPAILGRQVILSPRRVPIPFEVSYDPSEIDPRGSYVLTAAIESGDRVIFRTPRPYRAIVRGQPIKEMRVLLHRAP